MKSAPHAEGTCRVERHYATGEIILRRGEISPFLHMVVKGKVRVEEPSGFFYLSAGDFFGEEGAFLRKPSPFTVLAGDETVLSLLRDADLEKAMGEQPELASRIVRKSVARVGEVFTETSPFSKGYVRALLHLLPHLEGEYEGYRRVDISLMDLAENLGISLPSLRILLSESRRFGDVRLEEETMIFSRCGDSIRRRLLQVRRDRFFGVEDSGLRGVGNINLLSALITNL